MLSLHQYNNRLMANASQEYTRVDYSFFNQSRIRDMGMPRAKYLDHAMYPYLINNIDINNCTYMYDEGYTSGEYYETIKNVLNGIAIDDANRLNLLRFYTNNPDTAVDMLDSDAWVEVPDAIKTLYNTCTKQVELRENYTIELKIRVFKSRANHSLLTILNYTDENQASDVFLTIGLIPIIFEDYKELMCEEEMNYFSTLVKRSQVKRISNVAAGEAFEKLTMCSKYTELLRKESTNFVIKNIVRTKVEACEREVRNCERNAEEYLLQYQRVLQNYYKLNKDLQNIKAGSEELIEEVRTAITIPAIYKVDMDRRDQYGIEITMQTTCSFFELDEVECVMNNINEDTVFYKFLKDVFIDQKYKLHLGTTFRFSFANNTSFNPDNIINSDELIEMKCMFNPHLFRYSCLGDYKPKMVQAMQEQDLTMFINWGIASLKSINFRDGAVINSWKSMFNDMEDDYASGSGAYRFMALLKCLEDENGNRISIADAYLTPEEPVDYPELDVEEL